MVCGTLEICQRYVFFYINRSQVIAIEHHCPPTSSTGGKNSDKMQRLDKAEWLSRSHNSDRDIPYPSFPRDIYPDSKVHGANMGPIWGRQDPGGSHVGPMNFAIWVLLIILDYDADVRAMNRLIHSDRKKIEAILQTTFSSVFPSTRISHFDL